MNEKKLYDRDPQYSKAAHDHIQLMNNQVAEERKLFDEWILHIDNKISDLLAKLKKTFDLNYKTISNLEKISNIMNADPSIIHEIIIKFYKEVDKITLSSIQRIISEIQKLKSPSYLHHGK